MADITPSHIYWVGYCVCVACVIWVFRNASAHKKRGDDDILSALFLSFIWPVLFTGFIYIAWKQHRGK